MDGPEASKHGKKSTSQKLEDQKKVGESLLLCPAELLLLFQRNAVDRSCFAVCGNCCLCEKEERL